MIIRQLLMRLGFSVNQAQYVAAKEVFNVIKSAARALTQEIGELSDQYREMMRSSLETAETIKNGAMSLGLTTDQFQQLQYAAAQAGMTMEQFRHSYNFLARGMERASLGSSAFTERFARMGVKVKDSGGKVREIVDVMGDLADKFQSMPNGTEKTGMADLLFGYQNGHRMIAMLNDGRAGLDALMTRAKELGIVMDAGFIQRVGDLRDKFKDLELAWAALKLQVGAELAEDLKDLVKEALEWWKVNRKIVRQGMLTFFRLFSGSIRTAWAAFKLLIGVTDWFQRHGGVIGVILGAIAVMITGALLPAIGRGVVALYRFAAANSAAAASMLRSWIVAAAPLLAILALLVLIYLIWDDISTALDGGDAMILRIGDAWTKFLERFASQGSSEDPWWMTWLRATAYAITHLDTIWEETIAAWKEIFMGWNQWIMDLFTHLGQWISDKLTFSLKELPHPGFMKDNSLLAGLKDAGPNGSPGANGDLWGGTDLPGTAAAPSTFVGPPMPGQPVSQFKADFTINVPPTMNPADVGHEVEKRLDAWHNSKMEEAHAAVTGG